MLRFGMQNLWGLFRLAHIEIVASRHFFAQAKQRSENRLNSPNIPVIEPSMAVSGVAR